MPSRFDKYRIRDGVSRMGEKTLNPIFQDIDLRLATIENLRVSWESAVDSVTRFGLRRIEEVIGPTITGIVAKGDDIEIKRQAAIVALAELQSILANLEADVSADVLIWKDGVSADIDALATLVQSSTATADHDIAEALASLVNAASAALASIDAFEQSADVDIQAWKTNHLAELAVYQVVSIAYDDRGLLREMAPVDTAKALIEGLGLFEFSAGSDEPDDDESCFATADGRWLLAAAHWDLIDAWQLPDDDARDVYLDELNSRWPGRLLFGTADYPGGQSASAQAQFSGVVTGAEVGDMVLATPPYDLLYPIHYFARVTADNTVTIIISSSSGGTFTVAAGIWKLAVFKTI